MEAPEPHGGGVLHASTPQPPYVASSSMRAPDTPTPNRWLPEDPRDPLNSGIAQLERQSESNGTPDRTSETRSGIKRKASEVLGRPILDIDILDTGKAFAAQLQKVYQDSLEQLQTQLTEELQSWKAEQQAREGLYLGRITTLETEVDKLRTELEDARQAMQKQGLAHQSTKGPAAAEQRNQTQPQAQSKAQRHPPELTQKPQIPAQPPKQSTFADIAALLATRPGGQGWQEVPQRKKRQQRRTETTKQLEPGLLKPARISPKEARRLLFRREGGETAPRSEREDIILAVNRGLANEGFPGFIRAIDAGYSGTGAATVLLEKGALGSMLLPHYRDLLVASARQADPAIISVEIPEQWYRIKIHGVPVRRYLTCGLGLAREEIELGTEFRLKRNPTWLRSSRELQSNTKKGSTIVVTVGSLEEARKILVHGIRFGGYRYRTEHFWEVGVDTVCPRCCQLGHRSFKACGNHPACCFICAGPHEGSEHVCRVVDCQAKPGIACQHMPAKCGNCGGPHTATAGNCPGKREARKRIRKETQQASHGQQNPQTSHEPTMPSSPWFTVVDRGLPPIRARSLAPTDPETPRAQRPRATTLEEVMDLSEDQASHGAANNPSNH